MSHWAFIDVSWLAHRAKHTMKGLSHNEAPTGVMFGFFEELRTTCFNPRINTTQVGLFFDSRQSFRKIQFPGYKHKRDEKTPEELIELQIMRDQVERLRSEILPDIGFPLFRQTGLESDDLMAQAAYQLHDKSNTLEAILITADNDLYQCITFKTIDWYDPSPNRNLYYDKGSFFFAKGIDPEDWIEVKCMAGCTGDCVPGIPGVGETTAIKYLLKQLPEHHKTHQAIVSDEGRQIIERNHQLVVLPHIKTAPLVLEPPRYNGDAFFRWAEKLGMKSYLDSGKRHLWERFFNGGTATKQFARKRGE